MEEIEKLTQEERDAQELENLKEGYQNCKETYNKELERFKDTDAKLNMLLVFNAAILALLTIVFPLGEMNCVLKTLFYVFLTVFSISMLTTLISIILGLFPRKTPFIDSNSYLEPELYQYTSVEFYCQLIASYVQHNNMIGEKIEKKHFLNRLAMVCTIFNIVFMFTMIIFTII